MDKPKLLLNSAGDEFFMSDSTQFYFADIPGENNYLRYIPNTGHGLDARAIQSTISFMDAVENNRHLPDFSWTVQTNGEIHVHVVDAPTQVLMWQATNPNARDFRHGYNPSIVWTSTVLTDQGGGNYVGSVPYPASGATAFLVELTFPSNVTGDPYVFTTDVRVNSDLPRTPFPYTADPLALAALGNADPSFGVVDPADEVVPLFVLPKRDDSALPQEKANSVSVSQTTSVSPAAADIAAANTSSWIAEEDAELDDESGDGGFELAADSILDASLN
jgi:hypothetical protein